MPDINSVDFKKFERFLLKNGCEFLRQKGSHCIYRRKGLKRPIVVPKYKRLPPFIVLNNLRLLGVSKEDFLKEI